MTAALAKAFAIQADINRRMGSPLNGDLLERAAADLASGGPVVELLTPWAGRGVRELLADAIPLRLMAAVHDLSLSGEEPELSAAYAARDGARLWAAACAAMAREAGRMATFMEHEPQTNEVRRSAVLLPGFLEIARLTGLPLRCFEFGASAGLNQSWDRFHYHLGGAAWGDPASPVRLDTDWTGPPPAVDTPVSVVERAACDRRPVDLADPTQRRRLMAYVWADQPERLERLSAAIDVAMAHGVKVETADAAEWTARRVAVRPGTATVLFHSSVWHYLPVPTQEAITAFAESTGGRATHDAPFAWLRKEPPLEDLAADELTLTLWPGGETRKLATAHPHGAWVRWRGQL